MKWGVVYVVARWIVNSSGRGSSPPPHPTIMIYYYNMPKIGTLLSLFIK